MLTKVYNRRGIDPRRSRPSTSGTPSRLRPYVADTTLALGRALDPGKVVLLEGAQATMLDVDHGTYPFVTRPPPPRAAPAPGPASARPGSPTSSASSRPTHPRRRGALRPTELRADEGGEWLRKAGRRVRRDHRQATPLPAGRRAYRPVRDPGERHHRLLPDQAGRPVRPGPGAGLRGLPGGRQAPRRDPHDADRVPPRGAGLRVLRRLVGGHLQGPHVRRAACATRAPTSARWRR